MISNMERFYRFCSHLKRSPFSFHFIGFSIFQTILLFAFLAVLCAFVPSFINTKVSETVAFTGSEKVGYTSKGMTPSITAAKLVVYDGAHNDFGFSKKSDTEIEETIEEESQAESEQLEAETEKPAVLFISDIFVDESDSVGTLSYLAEKGYKVYAFSFYDRKMSYYEDWRDFNVIFKSFIRYENKTNPDKIDEKYDIITRFNYDKLKSALNIMTEMGIEKMYVLADGYCITPANQLMKENPDKILCVYNINHDNEISGYIDGHGNLSATRPLEWAFLRYSMNRKWDDAKRIAYFADKKFKAISAEQGE